MTDRGIKIHICGYGSTAYEKALREEGFYVIRNFKSDTVKSKLKAEKVKIVRNHIYPFWFKG